MRDRRFDPRLTALLEGVLQWRNDAGLDLQTAGRIEDLSFSGARIRVDRSLPVNTRLTLIVGDKQLLATVRYCGRIRLGYVIGVEFDTEYHGVLQALRQAKETVPS
jgi:hypothetical protein